MRLFAAIVPPPEVLDELLALVDSVEPRSDASAPRRGLLGRLASKAQPTGRSGVDDPSHHLDLVAPEQLHLPVTSFGNVTLADSRRLVASLRTAAESWEPPRVHFAGGTALEWPGDESVWAKLAGDVDGLMTIGREIPMVVQRLGFFVDRRQFRPWMSVGTITPETSAPYLERLVAALESHRGSEWVVDHVSLVRRSSEDDGGAQLDEVEKLPLGSA